MLWLFITTLRTYPVCIHVEQHFYLDWPDALLSGQANVIRETEPGPPSPPEDVCCLAMSRDKSRYESAIETCVCHTHYVYQHGTLNCQAHSYPSWEDTWHWRASMVGVGRWAVRTINENHFSESLFVTLPSLSRLSSLVSKFHSGPFHAFEWWYLFLLKIPSWLKYKNTVKCLQSGKKKSSHPNHPHYFSNMNPFRQICMLFY